MAIEFEVKVLEIDVPAIKKKLDALGARFVADRFMKRKTYDVDENKHKWMRLRDNGEQVTLTIKEIMHAGINGTHEEEVVVASFEKTAEILMLLGFKETHYQENKRQSFVLDAVFVEIDSWPGIPPYLEIEGSSEDEVLALAEKLGIPLKKLTTMNTFEIYDKYGFNIRKIPVLTFESFKKE
jgi:adenylate cyclase class 2